MTLSKKIGNQSIKFENTPVILGEGAVGGCKEGKGPLSESFDIVLKEDMFAMKTWEEAESKMMKTAMDAAMEKCLLNKEDVDLILSGDLINQTMASSFMARDMKVPFAGLYGACSTMSEALILGAVMVDGGYEDLVIASASSHYASSERQFRMPLEHANQRPPWASWTATAAGAVVIGKDSKPSLKKENKIIIESGTFGKVIDPGVKDPNKMNLAMAPAGVDTILNHLEDTGRSFSDYDKILTGDLGFVGRKAARRFFEDAGISSKEVTEIYDDCGALIYDREKQDVHGGGSGCGCSASVFSGYVLERMRSGLWKRVLLVSTGALLSTISTFQGETIPGIAHGVCIEAVET